MHGPTCILASTTPEINQITSMVGVPWPESRTPPVTVQTIGAPDDPNVLYVSVSDGMEKDGPVTGLRVGGVISSMVSPATVVVHPGKVAKTAA